MKLITAIIREVQLDKVREALIEADMKRITVSRVSGHGQQRIEEMYRGQIIVPDLIPKIPSRTSKRPIFFALPGRVSCYWLNGLY